MPTLMRNGKSFSAVVILSLLAILLVAVAPFDAAAQSESASVSGRVTDQQNAVVPDVEVELRNADTGISQLTKTNGEGFYSFPNVKPGSYVMSVRKQSFQTVSVTGMTLHVQDNLSRNFVLQIGSSAVSVTVTADQNNINTTDGSVGTVVDRQFVENMPLNGRSFQDLILLTPGIVTNTPQSAGLAGGNGEFSVNGQRTESNYYTVDGVSANTGTYPGYIGPEISGSVAASTALGTTQSLVSVDALEEFRVQSSTYSAEYGRNPGGQFSFVTRSGANQWHGTAYDYLRNDTFDANDWFNDYLGQRKPALRQNDFGGTLGGPIMVPHVYNGKDKAFFFFSYEGLRLLQPQAAKVLYVPDVSLRASAPAPLQQVLNAFPLPNCTSTTTNCINPGNGLAGFVGTWSNPSQIDSYSVRLDQSVNERLKLFFRFGATPSSTQSRGTGVLQTPSMNSALNYTSRTYTVGTTSMPSSRIGNEFRLNYTSSEAVSSVRIDSFEGGQAVDLAQLQGLGTKAPYAMTVGLIFRPYLPAIGQNRQSGFEEQWNLIDTTSVSLGRHQLKFGVDYRRLAPNQRAFDPTVQYFYFNPSQIQNNSARFAQTFANAPAYPIYTNVSAFAQDEWHLAPRLSVSMGLRWEVNPAPGAADGNLPYVVRGSSLSTLALAPRGTSLWNTSWFNFAPRLGAAYVLRTTPGYEMVVRAGGGVFFDTGQQTGSEGYSGPGFSTVARFLGAAFPLPATQVTPPIVNPPVAPYSSSVVFSFPSHLQLPFTLQWSSSIQQSLGKSQTLSVTYVGSNGRRLLQRSLVNVQPFNPNFGSVAFLQNGPTSDYNSLQVQFQRRLRSGLTALASYTWSHSIDYGSNNFATPFVRGNSDFDVRHNLSAAVSYDLPNISQNGFARAVLHHWGLDDRFTARTGFPITLDGQALFNPVTGQVFNGNLDLVPGQPIYLYGANCASVLQGLGNLSPGQGCPGGRAINPSAFTLPADLGTAPRNFVRGFGAWQLDLAVRREFPLHEGLKLEFRAEAFNVFNHPNFGTIDATFGDTLFGQPTATLAQSLGVLSPLYQMGGPRSMQFALKLKF